MTSRAPLPQDVYLRYAPHLPWALRGMRLRLRPGAHVGVCGRTGSGKSSCLAAARRLHEIEAGAVLLLGRRAYSALCSREPSDPDGRHPLKCPVG